MSESWVTVVYVQDYEAERGNDEPAIPEWGDRDSMAEYLSQWDFGDETDRANTRPGPLDFLPRYVDTKHLVGGLTYTLRTGPLGDAALYRRPLYELENEE